MEKIVGEIHEVDELIKVFKECRDINFAVIKSKLKPMLKNLDITMFMALTQSLQEICREWDLE